MSAIVITILASLAALATGARLMNRSASKRIDSLIAEREQLARDREANFSRLANLRKRITELPTETAAEPGAAEAHIQDAAAELQKEHEQEKAVEAIQAHIEVADLTERVAKFGPRGIAIGYTRLAPEFVRLKIVATAPPTLKGQLMHQVENAMMRYKPFPDDSFIYDLPASRPLTPTQQVKLKKELTAREKSSK